MEIEIFEIWTTDDAQSCYPAERSQARALRRMIDGTPRRDEWSPIDMKFVNEDEGVKFVKVDAPCVGPAILAIREHVIPIMAPHFEGCGELLRLGGEASDVFIFNSWIVDCLDDSASEFEYYSDGRRVMAIKEFVFREDLLGDVDIFKLPTRNTSRNYVTHRFVLAWKNAGLTGLSFKKVWSSKAPRFKPYFLSI